MAGTALILRAAKLLSITFGGVFEPNVEFEEAVPSGATFVPFTSNTWTWPACTNSIVFAEVAESRTYCTCAGSSKVAVFWYDVLYESTAPLKGMLAQS